MAKSYDFYDKIARKYDKMYDEITWNVHHEIIRRILTDEIKNRSIQKVMDLGSGTGRWTLFFAQMGFDVTAVEPSSEMIKVMKKQIPQKFLKKIDLVKSTAEKMEFSEEFDLVNAQGDVLSYLEDSNEGLQKINKALKPCGLFVGTVDSKYWFLKDLSRMGEFEEISALERNSILFIGDPSIDITFKTRLYTSKTLCELLENHGFKIIEISGIVIFGPYEEALHSKFEELVENELKYKNNPELINQAMHLHFVAMRSS